MEKLLLANKYKLARWKAFNLISKSLSCNSFKVKKNKAKHTVLMTGTLFTILSSHIHSVSAAVVSPCSGVSLPPSIITNIVGSAVSPLATTLDGSLAFLLGPLGLNSNLNTTLSGIAAGAPINLNVLDTDGNIVSPATECDVTANSYSLDTPKGVSIGGNQITGLGDGSVADAGEINSIAFGNNSITNAAAANSIAIGPNSSIGAGGTNSVVIGSGATTNVANSVVLGAGSTANTGAESNYVAYGLTAPQSSVGEVSVGSTGAERKITNVAAGSNATDAVNVSQLQAVDDGAVKYDPLSLKMTVTLGGPLSIDGGATGGTKISNLSQGTVNATSTDAINGAQLFEATLGFSTNIDALGLSAANNLGGGAVYNPATGVISAPLYNVYGTTQNNVGSAINALQTNAPVQYSDINGVATPNTISNDVTLVGATTNPVRIHNVADGIDPNDAVNKSQLDAVATNVGSLDALAVKYDDISKNTISLAGPNSLDGGQTGGSTISNVHQGELSATSTDAVNGSQLYATNLAITNIQNGTGIKYFHVNSSLADSTASGNESIAVGSMAVSNGEASIAIGHNSQATNDGAIAIGQNSSSTGINSIAIGTGALATGSVAVGVNAQAGNGGAAFGDNAIALTPQQGTAIGNAAIVSANRGVAIGAGSSASRIGMNGATEKYSNVSVTSTEGAVSVGSAGNERQITNVAGGTAATDAVNVRQLDAAINQVSNNSNVQFDALWSKISSLRNDANAGTASAMAMASMPQSSIPGKVLLAAGTAYYEGESSLAVGISNFSENGRLIINFNGTANSRGKTGAAVGVGIYW